MKRRLRSCGTAFRPGIVGGCAGSLVDNFDILFYEYTAPPVVKNSINSSNANMCISVSEDIAMTLSLLPFAPRAFTNNCRLFSLVRCQTPKG